MQTSSNSADQMSVAATGDPIQKSDVSEIAPRSDSVDTQAAYKLLSNRFIREHLLMRTVSWTFWMLVIGVAFAAAAVWLLFPG